MGLRSLLGIAAAALLGAGATGCSDDAATQGDAQHEDEQAPFRAWEPEAPRQGNLRIATFNIRNFPMEEEEGALPDGGAPRPPPTAYRAETDQEALLAILEKLAFDLMTVEEIRDTAALDALLAQLSERTGRAYASAFSVNAGGNAQHVGVIVDTNKLRLAWTREHEEVDVSGTLRPGLSARVESLTEGGVDFTLMSLHLASGDSTKRAALRAQQAGLAAAAAAAEIAELGDPDYLVLGDLNTAKEPEEFVGLDAAFSQQTPLVRQENPAGCTSYYLKNKSPVVQPSWLDQVYVEGLEELDTTVPIVSGAHCFERSCQAFESTSPETGTSYYSVSDHCPVYFEIADADKDAEPEP